MEEDSEYPKQKGQGSGSCGGYTVEARSMSDTPMQLGKQIFDNRWRQAQFDKGIIGVPSGLDRYSLSEMATAGLLQYSSAQALRWWLHANAEAELGMGLCLETKLIKHTVEFAHEVNAVSEHCLITGEDRSSLYPDWGKKDD